MLLDQLSDEARRLERLSAAREAELVGELQKVKRARERLASEPSGDQAGQEQARRYQQLESELRGQLQQHEAAICSQEVDLRQTRLVLEGQILQVQLASSEPAEQGTEPGPAARSREEELSDECKQLRDGRAALLARVDEQERELQKLRAPLAPAVPEDFNVLGWTVATLAVAVAAASVLARLK